MSLDFTKCLQLLSTESRRKPDAMNLLNPKCLAYDLFEKKKKLRFSSCLSATFNVKHRPPGSARILAPRNESRICNQLEWS